MTDYEIVALFNQRDEQAIISAREKYSRYCLSISWRILQNREDCDECLNDTWLAAWNNIPPDSPEYLGAYLGKITRNYALKKYEMSHAEKRLGNQIPLLYDELSECIPTDSQPEDEIAAREIADAINSFLNTIGKKERIIFVKRYYSLESTKETARHFGTTENHIRSVLSRTRSKLKKYLAERNYI